MTTIAWDGKFLAADSLMASGDIKRQAPFQKLTPSPNGRFVGSHSGTVTEEVMKFIGWVRDGSIMQRIVKANGTPLKVTKDDDLVCLLFDAQDMIVYEIDEFGAISLSLDAPHAYGSGRRFALGAMLAGRTAPDSVAITAKLDVYTGLPVECFQRTKAGRFAYMTPAALAAASATP